MERKIIKNGRGSIVYIPPALLELINSKNGDVISIKYNSDTKKIELSKKEK